MQRAHKIRLKPKVAQTIDLKKAVGCARYAYNWCLSTWTSQYALSKQGMAEKPDAYKMSALWTKSKPVWAYESPKDASQRAVLNVGTAFHRFWKGLTQFPSFKRRGSNDSFYVANNRMKVQGKYVHIPVIGLVRMMESLRFQGKIMSATVSCEAGDWFISISVEMPELAPSTSTSVVGVDVGVTNIAVASDGTKIVNPRLLKHYEEKLKKAQKALSRKEKRSIRREKCILKIQKIHQKIKNVRNDLIHKFTHQLAKNHGLAVIETLDVKGMKEQGKRYMRIAVQDTAMREVHRQLEYKMRTAKAPAFYRSSKTCSSCGRVVDNIVYWHTFRCECGHVQDRDDNASFNLRNMRWVTP